jgi:Rad3-related DNA helicase
VERFRKSAAPSILVSPSLEEGWDFVGDQARYQILVKVPFMDISTAIIKARHRSDKTYINYLVAQSLIQTVGRGMRSERDWCENFILDDHFNWMWAVFKQQNLIPDWFKAAFHYAQTVPSPLRFYK